VEGFPQSSDSEQVIHLTVAGPTLWRWCYSVRALWTRLSPQRIGPYGVVPCEMVKVAINLPQVFGPQDSGG